MARILVQTNDHRTVLDERDVHLADVNDTKLDAALLGRLRRAIRESQRTPGRARPSRIRPAAVTPVKSYLDLNG